MQYDKSAQQRWRYQGVSEAPGEHPLFQPTNAIEYIQGDIPCNTI